MEVIQTLDRDCSALAGLFQMVINDMKGSGPMWEDFLSRASKLHHALKATLVALSTFLDAFQKIADAATSTRGKVVLSSLLHPLGTSQCTGRWSLYR
ncbi:protein MTSS 2-like [Homarus americanus]|uniref:protein MTSS 2-like n=1 Tax=Homarus americanus TaxID=6706 RepID=UPI001C455EBA|nr:protein MTSS 2-like [Homarus americanus]